jgi:CubicO group peptidase (beta-lactamase class C family)
MGYGTQWWVSDNRGDYSGIGVCNQFIYVNRKLQLVIAKNLRKPRLWNRRVWPK